MAELTVAQASDRLGVDPSLVRVLLRTGAIAGRRHGRDWLVAPWLSTVARSQVRVQLRRSPLPTALVGGMRFAARNGLHPCGCSQLR